MRSQAPPTRHSPNDWAYTLLAVSSTLVILAVFLEPTIHRLVGGEWRQGGFVLMPTPSVDAHALLGYLFLGAMVAEVLMGLRQLRRGRTIRAHVILGRALVFILVPIFMLEAAWLVFEQSTRNVELSVLFDAHVTMTQGVTGGFLVAIVALVVRSYRMIRRGDVDAHVDAIFAAFMIASIPAYFRVTYFIVWFVVGECPLSAVGVIFATTGAILGLLAAAYASRGRLRANAGPMSALVGGLLSLALIGWEHYTIWDVG